jgi:hypothetical protein
MSDWKRRITFGKNGVLTLLLAGYVLMGLLVLEQGRIIDSQAVLIRSLFYDSSQLTALRMQPANNKR